MRHTQLLHTLVFVLLALGGAIAPCAAQTQKDAGIVAAYSSWSSSALHLAIRVEDPLVVGNQTLPMSHPWFDDAVAVYLDLNPANGASLADDCLRVVISAAGGASVQRGKAGEWQDDPAWFQPSQFGTIRYGTRVQGKLNDSLTPDQGYEVELALSWKLLNVQPPIRQRTESALPAIGIAFACYSQGETRSVSCWPQTLSEQDLDYPHKWGRLQFIQSALPMESNGQLACATLSPATPIIDGKVDGPEWMMAGVVKFTRQWENVAVTAPTQRQAISVVTAWYHLDTPHISDAHHPFSPYGPYIGPDNLLHHLAQLTDIRQAGIDALAVVMPLAVNHDSDTRLLALVRALQAYDRATSATYSSDVPLLMPVYDLATAPAGKERASCLQESLASFLGLVPPQYRFTAPDAGGVLCYPVILTASASDTRMTGAQLHHISTVLQQAIGRPIGWLPDTTLQCDDAQPGILARCTWDVLSGTQIGDGSVRIAMISPGISASRKSYLPRRDGDIFDNGWMKLATARPDIIMLRSWNDFRQGTEIAPSRQFDSQYLFSTKLATVRQAESPGFALRVLKHNLPAELQPGKSYPVEVLLKNGGIDDLLSREGCRVDYRITEKGVTRLSGTATDKIMLVKFSTARIRFTFNTQLDRRHALPEGQYQLHLDFRRNTVPFIDIPLMTRHLGTVTIPFAVSKDAHGAQLLSSDLPGVFVPKNEASVTLQIRNLGPRAWRQREVALHLQIRQGDKTVAQVTVPCARTVEPGDVALFSGKLACAETVEGWYVLRAELTGVDEQPLPILTSPVRVTQADICAEFLNINLPQDIPDETEKVETPIALRNAGQTPWKAQDTQIIYQWLTWDGQPIAGATGAANLTEHVKAGGATTLRMMVTPPPGIGNYRCAFTLQCAGDTATLFSNPGNLILPVMTATVRASRGIMVDLQHDYNIWAAHAITSLQKANIDGRGSAFPLEEFLPDQTKPALGYQPGYFLSTTFPGSMTFRFGQAQAGRAQAVSAARQKIALPAVKASALHLAAVNTGRTGSVPFTMHYSDGSEGEQEVGISNWLGAPAFNEPVVMTSRYLRTAQGDDWYLHGSMFAYTLPLDPKKTVTAISLPNAPGIAIFAMTLELPPSDKSTTGQPR